MPIHPGAPCRCAPSLRAALTALPAALRSGLLASLLAGCSALPGPSRPASVPAVAAWQAPLPQPGAGVDAAAWWQRFGDPLLPVLVESAQAASADLVAARARFERTRAARIAAESARLPQAGLAVSAARATASPLAAPATSAGATLQAGWDIDWLGAARAGADAAQAREAAAVASWHAVRVALAAETASAYASLRACEAQFDQAELDAASRAESARLTALSARAGLVAPADAALAEASAAQGRSQVASLRTQCDTFVKALVEVTGWSEPALRERLGAGRARVPVPPPVAVGRVPADVLQQRPDLYAAAREVEAAAGEAVQAAARERPQITIGGSLGAITLRSGGADAHGAVWSVGPLSVNMPLFDGGRRAADTVAARAAYDAAVASWQARARQAVREVEQALVTLDGVAARSADARVAAEGFEASLRATEARQRAGLASMIELESARRTAVAARSALLELERERALAWIALYRALGGGWNESLPLPPAPASK